jgi:ribose transport system permease protein
MATATALKPAGGDRVGAPKRGARQSVQQLLIFATLALLFVIFSLSSEFFLTFSNVSSLLLATAVTGIQALGLTFVIATGGIDLTPGLGMALCSVLTGTFLVHFGWPLPLGVLGGILSGTLIGLVNGLLIAKARMQPMIATLAMMLVAQGLALVISGASPIYLSGVRGFRTISRGTLLFGIPNAVTIFFVAAVVAGLLLNKSVLGRYAIAMGSNEEATRISGIDVDRWKVIVYMLAGTFTGLSGIVMAARLNSAQPATGAGYEMYAIAAVVIGGTSLRGGRANILGTVIGALIISTINNGLQILAVPDQWQKVVLGGVVIVAVMIDLARKRSDVS